MLKKKKKYFCAHQKKPVMRIKYTLFFLFLLSFSKLFAQEDPKFLFFPWSQSFYNPAAMGEKENHLNFVGILRQQSMLIKDDADPANANVNNNNNNNNDDNNNLFGKSKENAFQKVDGQQVMVGLNSYIKQIKGAVGVMFLKDKNAYFDNIAFKFGYASKFRIRRGKLGIGLQLGFLNVKPADNFNPNQPDDPTLTALKSSETFMDFDLSFGLHYKTPTWYVGVSGTQLIGGVRISGEIGPLHVPQQLYLMGGYVWNLQTSVPWSIEPHILFRSNLSTWSMDVMALARYNGILWFGLSYQLNKGIAVLLGAVPFYNYGNDYLKELEIGVAYNISTEKFSYKQGGGWGDFELVVRYGLNFFREKALSGYGSSRHLYKNQY